MDTFFKAIQNTPVPTLLILAGLLFILLGFVTKIGGMVEVSPEQKRWTIPVGLLVLTLGLVIHLTPTPTNLSEEQQENIYLNKLDKAIEQWSVEEAKDNLIPLSKSKNSCIAEFARTLETDLNSKGPEGFRNVNPIKRSLNEKLNCSLPIQSLGFSP